MEIQPVLSDQETPAMSKQQLIDAIRIHNRSAQDAFLVTFDQQVLETYLRRLQTIQGQRGPKSVWVRESDRPAMVTRVH